MPMPVSNQLISGVRADFACATAAPLTVTTTLDDRRKFHGRVCTLMV
jgi:hypothetical protein